MSNTAWLFVALLAVWLGIGGYLLTIALRQRKLEARLEELERPDRDADGNATGG